MDSKINFSEAPFWNRVPGEWRRVHGSFAELGLSFEWHDLRIDGLINWEESFHPDSLEICLNFSGEALLGGDRGAETGHKLGGMAVAVYSTEGHAPIRALRNRGRMHRFLTIELSRSWFEEKVQPMADGLKPELLEFLENKRAVSKLIEITELPPHLLLLRDQVLGPPVSDTAVPLWFQAKTQEIISTFLFRRQTGAELFCLRHRRQNREICERMLYLLKRDMTNPPSLELLAEEFGRSPFFLSRIFSEITGSNIPATLRKYRMEQAAKLLRDTGKTVTEIAFEVGYSSIGAFNKAFGDHFGTRPTVYRKHPSDIETESQE